MKYAIVNKSAWSTTTYIQEIELRETKAFLIDDKTGIKYKKTNSDGEVLAIKYNNSSHRYSRSTDFIYSMESEFVKKANENKRKDRFLCKVKVEVEILLNSIKNYEDALRVAEMLGLKVEQ